MYSVTLRWERRDEENNSAKRCGLEQNQEGEGGLSPEHVRPAVVVVAAHLQSHVQYGVHT